MTTRSARRLAAVLAVAVAVMAGPWEGRLARSQPQPGGPATGGEAAASDRGHEQDRRLAIACERVLSASPGLAGALVGAVVLDVESGRVLWSHDGARALGLASVTKIVTTAAALHALGPGFRWHTTILADGFDARTGVVVGDLIVRAGGDPTLDMASLRALARQVAWSGVRRVEGRLLIDGSYFADDGAPPHFDDQPGEYGGYRATVAAASLARNAVTVIVVANPTGRGPASIQLSPPGGDYVEVAAHQVATVARGDTRIWVSSRTRAGRVSLRVTGQIRHRDGVAFVRRRVDEPDRLLATGLRGALAEVGVRVHGGLDRGLAPATAIVVAERRSASLGAVVRAMNKTSDNFTAETVFKTLGAEHLRAVAAAAAESGTRSLAPPAATWLDAQHAVRRYLVEVVGLGARDVRIENGSGLYDSTGVSAHAVAQVLRSAYRDVRVGPELVASLAIGGVDGTLRRRLRDPAVRGRVRGKTGTLAGVSSLAGYVGVETGRPLALVVLVNRLAPHRRRAAHAFQDAIATLAADFTALRE